METKTPINAKYLKIAENISIRHAHEIISGLHSKYAKKFRGAKPRCELVLTFGKEHKQGKCDLNCRFSDDEQRRQAVEIFNIYVKG